MSYDWTYTQSDKQTNRHTDTLKKITLLSITTVPNFKIFGNVFYYKRWEEVDFHSDLFWLSLYYSETLNNKYIKRIYQISS